MRIGYEWACNHPDTWQAMLRFGYRVRKEFLWCAFRMELPKYQM